MTRICLTMIVKDEAHVIARCLESARDWVDYWVIIDTGSTDDTARIVRETMEGVPGELHERPWVNFAYNRQELLSFAQIAALTNDIDYALWIDADEVFTDAPTSRGDLDLTLDGYFLPVTYDGLSYQRLALTHVDREWRWVGPVHEYLELENAVSGNLLRPGVLVRHEGARSRDPETYIKDANLLANAVMEDPTNTRLRFYFAQSLRDAGELHAARDAYRERCALGGWDQEVFVSLLEIARLTERMGEDARDDYLSAYNSMPDRAEPLVELARLERTVERFHVAYMYASRAAMLPLPGPEALFVDTATYAWRAWDELALAAWYTGHPHEARAAGAHALGANPSDPRLIDNMRLMA